MEEACNYSKSKMEHLSCGTLCTHNLAFWRPCPFLRGRVVRIYVLLHRALKMYRVIQEPYTFWRPFYAKARILTLVGNRNLPFWRPYHILAPLCRTSTYKPNILGHMHCASYVCQAAGTSIIGGGAPFVNYQKALILWGSQAASPQWAPKELK